MFKNKKWTKKERYIYLDIGSKKYIKTFKFWLKLAFFTIIGCLVAAAVLTAIETSVLLLHFGIAIPGLILMVIIYVEMESDYQAIAYNEYLLENSEELEVNINE